MLSSAVYCDAEDWGSPPPPVLHNSLADKVESTEAGPGVHILLYASWGMVAGAPPALFHTGRHLHIGAAVTREWMEILQGLGPEHVVHFPTN
jgi:hypothetical protein